MSLIDEVVEALNEEAAECGAHDTPEMNQRAAELRALSSRLAGKAIVPVEPTEAQIDAGLSVWGDCGGAYDSEARKNIANEYRAMLNAAEAK